MILVTAAATAAVALGLSFATGNRVARGKLRFAALIATVAVALAAALRVPDLAVAIPPAASSSTYSFFSPEEPNASRRKSTFTPARARSIRIALSSSASAPGLQ